MMMQIDQAKIENAIVRDAVQSIISDDDIYASVKTGLDKRIDALFESKVSEQIAVAVEQIVKDGFDREYHRIDSFGRAVGDKTSIRKELETLVQNYWTARVDRNGNPADSAYETTTRAEWMMVKICADDFSKEMKQHVVNVSGALKDHFRSVLNQHVAVLLSDVFRVQSQGDREAKNPGVASISPAAKP